MYGFVESVAGPKNGRRFFPLFATIFLFVVMNAWMGLLPFYASLGFLNEEGEVTRHLLRPAGTDLNMPLALAIVSFVFVEYWGIRVLKLRYFTKFFRFGALLRGNIFQGVIDIFVGFLELLSEFVRIISFTFRLFGNMTAGEILLLVTAFLIPFVFTLPFYGLELLVGFIQALIFSGLTLVFVTIAVMPHEAEEH
jgi:F-type H+-transporting ATPase subunit a